MGLVARGARQRVVMVGAVELVDPLVEVLHVVGVHQVHDDGQAQFVGAADEFFQLLGDGHQLHGVVAVLFYYR